jgi:hypothetical protein
VTRRSLLVAASVAGAVCAGAGTPRAFAGSTHDFVAGPAAKTPTAWQAKVTYAKSPGSVPTYSGLRLSVTHLGKLVFDMPVKSSLFPAGSAVVGGLKPSSVSFRDLNGDGTPELILVLWTGGAHCCYLDQIFDFTAQPAHKTEIDFRDSGARTTTVNGRVILLSADDRFDYAFTDYADSASPIQIWQYQRGRLVDTTRSFPGQIGTDAARWWSRYLATRRSAKDDDVRGILAAWAADESLLGDGAAAQSRLLEIATAGDLNHGSGAPKGKAYVAAVWKFLASHGYLR